MLFLPLLLKNYDKCYKLRHISTDSIGKVQGCGRCLLIVKLAEFIVVAIVIISVIFVENGTVEDVWMLNHLCQSQTSIFV